MKNSIKYFFAILILSVGFSCEDEPDEIIGTNLVLMQGETQLSGPYSLNIDDEITFIVDGNAEFYTIWPGTENQRYEDYGNKDAKGNPAKGIALSKNDQGLFTGTYTYTQAGTFNITLIGKSYNYKAANSNEVILNEQIIISE